jgi:hypothetical protein
MATASEPNRRDDWLRAITTNRAVGAALFAAALVAAAVEALAGTSGADIFGLTLGGGSALISGLRLWGSVRFFEPPPVPLDRKAENWCLRSPVSG